jgi:DNA polymerase-1
MAATLALIDASGFLYRAFHAVRGLSAPDGRPTNATFGFATMLRKYLEMRKPAACAVAFDRKEKTFRHEMDENYKAQRAPMPDDLVPQIEDAKRLCRAMGLAVVEEPGFEADDLIATLATKGAAAGLRIEVASSDKDLFQLVQGDQVVVWHPKEERILDAKGVEEFFGAPPERVIDVLALMGDASDNIPGVAGIGEKGARELVSAFGALENVYASLDQVKGKKRDSLERGRDAAFRSKELATVRRDVPVQGGDTTEELLDTFRVSGEDRAKKVELAALFDELGFSRLKKEMGLEGLVAERRSVAVEVSPAEWNPEGILERAKAAGKAGIHIEFSPGHPYPPKPVAVCLSLPGGESMAFPASETQLLAAVFAEESIELVAHDSKKLFGAAATLGITPPRRFADVMLASYVEAAGIVTHDLEGDSRFLLQVNPDALVSQKDVLGPSGAPSLDLLATERGRLYLAQRSSLPLRLEEALTARLPESRRVILAEFELPLVPVLARMEARGIAVDEKILERLSGEFDEKLKRLEAEIFSAAGETFNVGSPAQLGRILFEKLNYPVLKKTEKTKSFATGSEVLEELAARGFRPLPGLVLSWREISKLKGTYVDPLPSRIAADGRVHSRFDQAVAATGRLSSNDPNLQNIPVRTAEGRAIRSAFVAPPGRMLVSADYSQIELRLLAHLSGDDALVAVFRKGEDIHRATAARVFGIDPALVSSDQRRGAKAINFGILYGMGPFALAGQLGVPQSEAKVFIRSYFERFPKIKGCLDAIIEEARQKGGTETIFGRFRPIPGLKERNFNVRMNAERMALNAPFQGSAADLIKKAMIELDAALSVQFPSAGILLQVHDELLIECDESDAAAVTALVKSTMEGVARLKVPLTVDTGIGRHWAEMK